MENIVLKIVGTKATAEYNGELTSGSVGIPVVIQYDESWDGLSKFVSFRVGSFQRTREKVGENTTVPWEVMRYPGKVLELGVEGRDSTGGIVIPTIWASVKTIKQGANKSIPAAAGSPTSDGNSSDGGISVETDPTVPAWAKQPEKPEYTAQEVGAVATVNGIHPDESGNVKINIPDSGQNAKLTTAQINALDGMFKVCAFIKDDVSAEYNAFKTAFGISDSGGEEEPDEPATPEKTLTSISAVYSGGDVPVGTAVAALTGIVVTAHYSDGTSEIVTGYTLTGEIAEGENTVTVSYGGKTTTITVSGVAQSSGLPQYEYTVIGNYGLDNAGETYYSSQYDCSDYIEIDPNYRTLSIATYMDAASDARISSSTYVQWFNGDTFLSRTGGSVIIAIGETKCTKPVAHTMPEGATKFRIAVQTNCDRFVLYKGTVSASDI